MHSTVENAAAENAANAEQANTADTSVNPCRFHVVFVRTVLDIRDRPSTRTGHVIDTLKPNEITTGDWTIYPGEPGAWYRVRGDRGNHGYASANYLQPLGLAMAEAGEAGEAQPGETGTAPHREEGPPGTAG